MKIKTVFVLNYMDGLKSSGVSFFINGNGGKKRWPKRFELVILNDQFQTLGLKGFRFVIEDHKSKTFRRI